MNHLLARRQALKDLRSSGNPYNHSFDMFIRTQRDEELVQIKILKYDRQKVYLS